MPGLGFSSKIPASQHQMNNHVRWMNALLTDLDLGKLIYVGQDWGGPIGMGALAKSHGLMQGAVIMNTGWIAPKEQRDLSRVHALAKTPIVGEIMLEVVASVFDRLPQIQGDPESMPPAVIDLYKKPVNESGNKKAPLALMRMVPDGPLHPSIDEMKAVVRYSDGLNIPTELVWGTKDPILGAALTTMEQNFPNARVTETQAGHFLQEEVPEEIAAAIKRVYASVSQAGE
jgi:haloalkane dehalogenase